MVAEKPVLTYNRGWPSSTGMAINNNNNNNLIQIFIRRTMSKLKTESDVQLADIASLH